MLFSKMTISKRIILGYSVFFVLFLLVGVYSIVKNLISINQADTLDINNRLDVVVSESVEHFLNARAEAREMVVTKDYSDSVYSSVLKDLDESIEHMEEFLGIVKDRNESKFTAVAGEIISGIKNYREIVISKYELDRVRNESQNKIFGLGVDLSHSFEETLMMVSMAMSDASSESMALEQMGKFTETMHRLNLIASAFSDVRIAVRNVLFLDDIAGYNAVIESLNAITAALNAYEREVDVGAEVDYNKLLSSLNLYGQHLEEYKDLTEKGVALANDMDVQYINIQEKVENTNSITLENLNGVVSDISVSADNALNVTIVIVIILLLINIVLSTMIRNSINADLMKSVRSMMETATSVRTVSRQLTDSSGSLARGNTEQAASIEETSAAMNQTAAILNQNSKNTEQAVHLSQITSKVSEDGVKQVGDMINFMDTLTESSDKISKIISDINTIASQTSILALNASIEAVRAGETGRSFSVVAEEVKNLAQQITDASDNTATIIKENILLTQQGAGISKEVGTTLEKICSDAKKVSGLLGEISASSMEQVQGTGQVTNAMAQIEKVTQINSAASEESAATANELQIQSDKLQEIIQRVQTLVGTV